jgi:streptogramin lyase
MLLLVLAVLPATSASAAPQVDGVFEMKGVTTNGQLVVGPDGNIWVSLESAVARVQPDGTVTEFVSAGLNNTLGSPTGGITSAGGFIWVSQGAPNPIVKIPPGNPAGAANVTVAGVDAGTTAMTTGPDGKVWVALPGKVVKFSPSNSAEAATYTADFTGLSPRAITASPDGTLWVTDNVNGQLLNITTGGTLVHPAYTVGGGPQFIGAAPSGQVAFGNPLTDPQQIGLLSPGGSPQTLNRPNGSDPFGVAFGDDGAFWIAEFAGNRLTRVTTDGQLTTLTGFPTDLSGRGPRQITTGPGHTLWATLDRPGFPDDSKIARITGVEPPPTGGDGGGGPGGGAPPPPDTTPPVISSALLSKSNVPAGTTAVTFRFATNEAGTANVVLSRRLPGRRRGTACVKPTRKLRHAKRCNRLVRVRTVNQSAVAGANAVRLRIKTLPAGRYRATLTVADAAGNRAAPVSRTLTITKKRSRA